MLYERGQVLTRNHIQTGYHKRFRLAALSLVFRSLERFIRIVRKAVEIQAVIPVRAPYERQAMRAKISPRIFKTYEKVLKKRLFRARDIVERNHFIQNREIPRLLKISHSPENKPERVIVESSSYVIVPALGKRLILMIASPVRKLRGCDVQYAGAGTRGNLMNKPDKVLIGIPEAHTAPDSAFKKACAAAHVERHHALILVPNIHHTVQFRNFRLHLKTSQKIVPIILQLRKSLLNLLRSAEG